jgi:hypothetical protein
MKIYFIIFHTKESYSIYLYWSISFITSVSRSQQVNVAKEFSISLLLLSQQKGAQVVNNGINYPHQQLLSSSST